MFQPIFLGAMREYAMRLFNNSTMHFPSVSKDLIRWEYLGLAIESNVDGQAFSGSAVVDKFNASSLQVIRHDVLDRVSLSRSEALVIVLDQNKELSKTMPRVKLAEINNG